MKNKIKKFLQWGFSTTGFAISRHPKHNGQARFSLGDLSYGINIPYANYAPWEGNEAFKKAYAKIKGKTLVDRYRCYEIWEAAHQLAKQFPASSFFEVGVYKGGTALLLLEALKAINSSGAVFLADTFEGVVNAGEVDAFYKGGEHADTSLEATMEHLKGYQNIRFLKGMFPQDTAHLVPANVTFSLVHIDVDVYQSAKDCMEWAWPKLLTGGIVIFDDYGFHSCTGVTKLVNDLKEDTDKRVIHNLNGHAIVVKL